MLRVDRILADLRALRILRAHRIQVSGLPSSLIGWRDECDRARELLGEMSTDPHGRSPAALSPGDEDLADRRVMRRCDILDRAHLEPFHSAAVAALEHLIADSAIIATLADRMGEAFAAIQTEADAAARAAPTRRGTVEDFVAERRSRLLDAATLVVEDALFEVVRRVIENADLARVTRYPSGYKPQLSAAVGRLPRRRGRAAGAAKSSSI